MADEGRVVDEDDLFHRRGRQAVPEARIKSGCLGDEAVEEEDLAEEVEGGDGGGEGSVGGAVGVGRRVGDEPKVKLDDVELRRGVVAGKDVADDAEGSVQAEVVGVEGAPCGARVDGLEREVAGLLLRRREAEVASGGGAEEGEEEERVKRRHRMPLEFRNGRV